MKNLQQNEKHLADKLQNVPVPDVDQSWEQMRSLLDREMPRAGTVWGGNRKWWWMSITVGFIILATWLAQSLTSRNNQIADKKQSENKNISSANKDNNTPAAKDDKTAVLNPNKDADNNNSGTSGSTGSVSDDITSTDNQPISKNDKKDSDTDVRKLSDKNVKPTSVNEQKARENRNNNSARNIIKINKNTTPENRITSSGTVTHKSETYTNSQLNNDKDKDKKDKVFTSNADQLKKDQNKNEITKSNMPDQNNISDKNPGIKDQTANAQDKNSTTDEIVIDASLVNSNLMLQEQSIAPAALFNTADGAEQSATIIAGKTDKAFLREMRQKGMPEDNRKINKARMNGKTRGSDRELTFAAGLALPQNLAIGAQQASSYNINARNNLLLDYLPAPYFEYHLNTKLFLQTEFHFQAPQYTERLLLSRYTFAVGSTQQQTSKYLEKLYYFNIPFNVYYSPARNFYIGGGLQYSSLLGGVTTWEEKRTEGQNILSYKSTATRFKDDSLTTGFSPSEWRYQFDANYYFNRFTLGLRFNQAMKDYINRQGPTPGTAPLRERNQSFLLYLRFNIWEERKKETN